MLFSFYLFASSLRIVCFWLSRKDDINICDINPVPLYRRNKYNFRQKYNCNSVAWIDAIAVVYCLIPYILDRTRFNCLSSTLMRNCSPAASIIKGIAVAKLFGKTKSRLKVAFAKAATAFLFNMNASASKWSYESSSHVNLIKSYCCVTQHVEEKVVTGPSLDILAPWFIIKTDDGI